MTNRKDELNQWLNSIVGANQYTIKSASEDASFRSYYRLTSNQNSLIVMDAPPELEDCKPFIKVQKLLGSNGINVPKIHAYSAEQGFMLLDDFGTTLFLDLLDENNIDELYQLAISELIKIQAIEANHTLPLYNETLLTNEMQLFIDWFIGQHLAYQLNDKEKSTLDHVFQLLIENATSQPQVLVHRDYHSRNIMFDNNKAGIIDFQDAVFGPITYDLASLLKDCYISWPKEVIDKFVRLFIENSNLTNNTSFEFETFKKWFDLMAAQRHMKAIGIFCRLNYRDGKKQYLYDIPRTMKYLIDTCQSYPELVRFHELLIQIQPTLNHSQ